MFKRWVQEAMGDTSVVREQYQPARILIETSNRKDTGRGIYYVDNTFPILLRTGTLDASWLIHSIIDETGTAIDELARELHRIFFRIDRLADQGRLAIDDDVSAFYGFFGMATGTHTTF